jgi:hypothetical protein
MLKTRPLRRARLCVWGIEGVDVDPTHSAKS